MIITEQDVPIQDFINNAHRIINTFYDQIIPTPKRWRGLPEGSTLGDCTGEYVLSSVDLSKDPHTLQYTMYGLSITDASNNISYKYMFLSRETGKLEYSIWTAKTAFVTVYYRDIINYSPKEGHVRWIPTVPMDRSGGNYPCWSAYFALPEVDYLAPNLTEIQAIALALDRNKRSLERNAFPSAIVALDAHNLTIHSFTNNECGDVLFKVTRGYTETLPIRLYSKREMAWNGNGVSPTYTQTYVVEDIEYQHCPFCHKIDILASYSRRKGLFRKEVGKACRKCIKEGFPIERSLSITTCNEPTNRSISTEGSLT